jgi:hypothetical protein
MSRSYPIWNKIQACIYKSDKSFGAKDHSKMEIMVGSSQSNSHLLGKIETIRKEYDDEIHFKLKLDDIVIRRLIFKNQSGRAGDFIKEVKL